MKATALAHPNIALIKYWGKRNEDLVLPYNNSLSVTISGLEVKTTVQFDSNLKEDDLTINGEKVLPESKEYQTYFKRFLSYLRSLVGKRDLFAKIVSYGNFPPSSGLASSAAGFAALSLAANEALRLNLSKKQLSILARHGSGSASRSIFGGFVQWRKGVHSSGEDSFAMQIYPHNFWQDFRVLVCLTTTSEKKVKSRYGMQQTVKTSKLYHTGWLTTVEYDLREALAALREQDLDRLGKVAQDNAIKMHATMMTTNPPIFYWNSVTMDIIHQVLELNNSNISVYFTIDAGPQVKLICLAKDAQLIMNAIKGIKGCLDIIEAKPAEGAQVIHQHLF